MLVMLFSISEKFGKLVGFLLIFCIRNNLWNLKDILITVFFVNETLDIHAGRAQPVKREFDSKVCDVLPKVR